MTVAPRRLVAGLSTAALKLLSALWHPVRRSLGFRSTHERLQVERGSSACTMDGGRVVAVKEEAPTEPPNWELLRPTVAGFFVPTGGVSTKPVWRGEEPLSVGRILYRGCRSVDTAAALRLLEQPRFWSHEVEEALKYARQCLVPEQEYLPGFLVIARVTSPILLANMALYPVTEAVLSAPRRFGVKPAMSVTLQRLHCTDIARAFAGRDFDGVIDGPEILLADATRHVEILDVDQAYSPRTKALS